MGYFGYTMIEKNLVTKNIDKDKPKVVCNSDSEIRQHSWGKSLTKIVRAILWF